MLHTRRREQDVGPKEGTRYWGSYVGFVRDTADPERRGRVRLFVPEVGGDVDDTTTWTDWALPKMSLAGFDTGAFMVPPSPDEHTRPDPDDDRTSPLRKVALWVEFRHGDPRFPIYTGGFWYAEGDIPNYTPSLSDASNGGDETVLPPNGSARSTLRTVTIDSDGEATVADGQTAEEPRSSNEAQYPRNRFYKSPSGHVVELDDTPNAERIKVYHRAGCYFEMDPVGSLVTKVTGKRYDYVSDDEIHHVVGTAKELFDRDKHEQVAGALTNIIGGSRTYMCEGIERRYNRQGLDQRVSGAWNLEALSAAITSFSNLAITSDDLSLAGQNINAIGVSVNVLGAQNANVTSTSGVTLSGLLGALSAVEPIIGGASYNAALATFNGAHAAAAGTLGGITATYLATLAPGSPEFIWVTGVNAYLTTLGTILSAYTTASAASLTIHRVSKT